MGPHAERFLHPIPASAAILRGELGGDRDHWHVGNQPIRTHPGEEQPPTGIADAFCQLMILDEMGNLEVFIGHHVARLEKRSRSLDREIFPLPTHFQMPFSESFDRSLAVLLTFLFAVQAMLEALEVLFGFAQRAGIGNGVAFRIGVADELHGSDSFSNRGGLCLADSQLVVPNQHGSPAFWRLPEWQC